MVLFPPEFQNKIWHWLIYFTACCQWPIYFFSPPPKDSPGAHSKHHTTSRHQTPEPHSVAQALLSWHITYNFFSSSVYLLRGWQMVSRTLKTSLGLKNPWNLFWNPNVTCFLVRLNRILNFASEGSCNTNSNIETFCFLNCSFCYVF